eukprot:gene15017-24660_t
MASTPEDLPPPVPPRARGPAREASGYDSAPPAGTRALVDDDDGG